MSHRRLREYVIQVGCRRAAKKGREGSLINYVTVRFRLSSRSGLRTATAKRSVKCDCGISEQSLNPEITKENEPEREIFESKRSEEEEEEEESKSGSGTREEKMLPTTSRSRSSSSSSRANPMFLQYFRRIVKWQQMDIEYTFWQMLNLCTSPKVVYQHTKYHKQTKNQWARDDPAFIVICSLLLAVATVAYCATYDHSGSHAVVVVVSVLLSHFLITGAVIATCCWFLTNSYLREEAPNSHVVEQRVEWLYTFDVHCNSFFPMFVLLYVVHYFLSPLLITHGFIPLLLSNLLFMVGASYYHYLNFLGYDVLPFLERTTFFLYPIGVVIVLSPILILSGFNPSRYFMNMYFSQRL